MRRLSTFLTLFHVCCEVMMFASMSYVLRTRADSESVAEVLFVFDPCALVGACLRVLLYLSLPRGGCLGYGCVVPYVPCFLLVCFTLLSVFHRCNPAPCRSFLRSVLCPEPASCVVFPRVLRRGGRHCRSLGRSLGQCYATLRACVCEGVGRAL